MLSINKVKLHGMKDPRWTTRDKICQYKGVINLYTRDQKIVEVDNTVYAKELYKDIKKLKKDIIDNRSQLDNAIYGDKQIIRNILAEYDEFRLAFKDLAPMKIIEHIHQNTFNKRKLLDLLNFKIKQKTDNLIELKLRASVLEDRLKYGVFDKLPAELLAATITGKVQDANLKRVAALSVQHSYKAVIAVMRKDHTYMFQVLEALMDDARNQGRCMFNTTQLGQLATEYLDDRKQEFKELEAAIKMDMKRRDSDLQDVRAEVEHIDRQVKRLLRRDSDITLPINHKKFINDISMDSLGELSEYEELEKSLEFLKELTLVSNFDCIFPCIQEQFRQKERLDTFMTNLVSQRDGLFKKLKHAHQMYKKLAFEKGESRYGFEIERDRLKQLIEEQKQKEKKTNERIAFKSDVILKIRISLQHIEQLLWVVTGPKSKATTIKTDDLGTGIIQDTVSEDVFKTLEVMESKLPILVQNCEVAMKENESHVAMTMMQQFMDKITCTLDVSTKIIDESLIEGIIFEDPTVPSRQDIKRWSSDIVAQNTKDEDVVLEIKKKTTKITKGKK